MYLCLYLLGFVKTPYTLYIVIRFIYWSIAPQFNIIVYKYKLHMDFPTFNIEFIIV